MDQQQQQQSTSFPSVTVAPPTADASPSFDTGDPPQQPLLPRQSQPQGRPPSTPSAPQNPSAHHIPKPSPEPTPQVSSAVLATPQPRPSTTSSTPTAAVSRPWQQNSQFSSPQSPSVPTSPTGGLVLGIPASRPSASAPAPAPPSPSGPFSASVRQQFGGVPQGRQPLQRMQGIATVGSIVSGSQVRPGGIGAHPQQRPAQSAIRSPSSPSSQSPFQNFQGPALVRASAVGSSAPRVSSIAQSTQQLDQASISLGSQGRPPLPRPTLLQRSQVQQQPRPLHAGSQLLPTQPPKLLTPTQQQDHSGQQLMQSRIPVLSSHQNQVPRGLSSMVQKPSDISKAQLSRIQLDSHNETANALGEETEKRILSKRSIHELVNQIGPSEKLDPEVADILVDIAEDFVDSITTFGCSLAKHRKSDILEAKDILLHLERNWNMTIPGFGGDEIKTYRKQVTTDIHKERLAAIKKTALAAEVANTRSSAQAAVNSKSNLGKAAANALGSPNYRVREVA